MENKGQFKEKGLNVATNSREPAAEEILVVLSKSGNAADATMISKETGYSTSTIKKWLNILKREGLVLKNGVGKTGFFSLRGKK